jgi:hypothetical protein
MSKGYKFTYLLYLIKEYNTEYSTDAQLENIIFLGTGREADKLYYNGLDAENANKDTKATIITWLTLVQDNLDEREKKDMEYAFMYRPESEFVYSIKNMTLCIKRIKNLN